jgi:hypothetical protein
VGLSRLSICLLEEKGLKIGEENPLMRKNALYFAAVPFQFPLFICHHLI